MLCLREGRVSNVQNHEACGQDEYEHLMNTNSSSAKLAEQEAFSETRKTVN